MNSSRVTSVRGLALAVLAAAAMWIGAFPSWAVNPYGLTNRTPLGPFLNTNLPPFVAVNTGNLTVVPAFPNLTFDDPTFLIAQPGTNRLLVCGRQGTIWSFVNDPATSNKVEFLSLTNRCQGYDDCGLLGLAFHPQFGQAGSTNRGYVYVYYQYNPIPTNPLGNRIVWTIPTYNRLSRFTVPDGSLVADPNSELILVNQYDRHVWHNGGGMFFGPDGFLYWSSGDEGDSDDFYHDTQKINQGLFSGVMRVDVDQDPTKSHPVIRQPISGTNPPAGWLPSFTANYYIPNDNPFVNTNGSVLEEFYALGFRSPHRMTLDPPTGQIWLGDVGDSSREEVDLVVKGGNYQWAYGEGLNFPGPNLKPSPLIGIDSPPIYDYPHANANSCIIGGYVYRGTQFASDLGGLYIFGDDYSGRIWTLAYNGTNPPTVNFLCNMPPGAGYSGGLSSFGRDSSNELYMCAMGIGNGAIYKFAHITGPQVAPPPTLLSQVGAFTNLATLAITPGLIPYTVNCPLWSDGAVKSRWMALPYDGTTNYTGQQINFASTGEWSFPVGTVFVKHFELHTNDNDLTATKRLETRVLVANTNGGYYGLTYKWRADYSDADLLTNSLSEDVSILTTNGGTRTQTWYYPSQQDCLLCHNANASFILGVKSRQLNGNLTYPSTGVTDNQLRTLNNLGMLNPTINESDIPTYPALSSVTNTNASLDTRMRSYIDSNCSQCHRPNSGVQANFDARFDTPLTSQAIINGILADSLGITGAKVVAPSDISRSIMHLRIDTVGTNQMPPIARNVIDTNAVATLEAWINSYVPPSITQQPVGQAVFVGNSIGFMVVAAGTGPFSYQWQQNGQSVAGATDSAFNIASVVDANSGTYTVLVSSLAGNVLSSNAVLTVNGPPNILTQPQSQSVLINQPVTFSVTASGSIPLIYQWEFNSVNIPGATNNTFTLPTPQMSDAGVYSVLITNLLGTALSSNAVLAVTPPSATNWLDSDIGFVVPSGGFTLSNGVYTISGSGDDIYGTNDAFHFVYQTITGDGSVVARVTQIEDTADWAKGGVMFRESLDPGAKNALMAISWTNGSIFQYRTATAGASGNSQGPGVGAPYWVKLVRSGSLFSGYISANGLVWSQVGSISISMSNTVYFGLALTAHNDGVLNTSTFDNLQFLGSMLEQPQSVDVGSGTNVTFSGLAFGAPLYYQWQFNGSNIAGAVDSAFSIANVQPFNAGNYTLLATNLAGTSTSAVAVLTVDAPVTFVTQPQSQSVNQGSTVNFSVVATGNGTLTYQWQLGSSPISGATASSFSLTNVQTSDSGNYSVIVTCPAGSVSSAPAVLTVNGVPIISTQPQGQNVTVGSPASFTVTATGATPLNYQWEFNAAPIPGATNSSFLLNSPQLTDAGSYSVLLSNAFGTALSSNAVLAVTPPSSTNWLDVDIGDTFPAGSFVNSNGVFTVKAAGDDIWGSQDNMHYVYQSLTGDGAVVARVALIQNTADWAKGGVMFRESLDSNSKNAFMAISFTNGASYQYRTATGGDSSASSGPGVHAPYWVKLVRSGSSFSGYVSSNGLTWVLVDTISISMSNTVYFGVALTSHNNGQLNTTTFDHIQFMGSILQQPANLTVSTGANATFNVIAFGSPLQYQWKFKGTNLAGALNSSYVVTNAQPAQVGNYSVAVTNLAGTLVSSNALLVVNVPQVVITTQPQSQTINQSSNATFSVTATGPAPLTYQWALNSSTINGATNSSFTINNAQATDAGNYSVTVSGSGGSATSSNALLTVNLPPLISGQPQSQSATAGSNVTFTVTATGSAPLSYQWQSSTGPIAGATASAYTRTNVQPADADNYSVVVTNIAGSITSTAAALTVNVPPGITTQPSNKSATAGSNVTFRVTATGTAPLSYQWQSSSGPIGGATASAYTRTNVQPADAGSYSVVITNIAGSITSSAATLTVNVRPGISAQPLSQSVTAGSNVTFTVTATGTAPLKYQWQSSAGPIAGATTSSYTRLNVQPADADNYFVVVTNVAGTITSSAAILTVNVPPGISTQPLSQSITAGSNVTFTVTTTGTAPLSYQWQSGSGLIVGATNSSYCRTNVQPADAGSYSVVVTNIAGTITSSAATLTVNVPPGISTQPLSQPVTAGSNVTFTVTATGTAPLSYQWQSSSGPIAGATSSSYTRTNVQPADVDSYSVVVTNIAGAVTSFAATLAVNVPPGISTQPLSQSVTAGSNVTFTVTATGTAPLSYQWQSGSGLIVGATNSSYCRTNVQPADAGSYSVVVTNIAGTITSSAATLTVNVPPGITTQPLSQTVTAGSNVTFTVTATGTAPLSYQWQYGSSQIIGATNSSYCRTNVQPADAGSYSVVVTNIAGTITSSAATLTVNTAPAITTQPQSQFVAAGSNVTFTVTATGTAPLVYQWSLNGTNISGATDSAYIRLNVQPPDAGSYSVVVTNAAGSAPSLAANLVINTAPVLSPIADQTIFAGLTLTITNVATDADVPTNTLTFGLGTNAPIGAAINSTNGVFTWTPATAQGPSTNLITVFVFDNGIPSLTNYQSFNVTVVVTNSPPVLTAISNRTIHALSTLTFTAVATDPDIPANVLTFTLATNTPAGAVIDPATGVFSWTPTDSQVGTNNFTVIVTDNGVPPLSDNKSFAVTVVTRPQFLTVAHSSSNTTLTWTTIPGQNYQLQYKLNVKDAAWLTIPGSISATNNTAGFVDTSAADRQRFYRVAVLP